MNIVTVPWLKHNSRSKLRPLNGVILHHTAGASATSTIRWLRKVTVRASYHYILARDGVIYKCVPVKKRAWHAGFSVGKFGRFVNSNTIGIAFANRGDGEVYTEAQITACHQLLVELVMNEPNLSWISTHRLITNRKNDPKGFGFHGFVQQHKLHCDLAGMRALKPFRYIKLNRSWDG